LIADHVKKLILVHHSPIDSSLKFQEALKRIVNEIACSEMDSEITKRVKKHWSKESRIIDFLNLPEISEVLIATNDLTQISKADIILSGTSASTGFLSLDLFKNEAIIVDVAVPPSIRPDLLASIEKDRPDLTYHLGGVANIPGNQSIDFYLLPLRANESYACMAETFSIGFSGKKNFLNIGDLDKNVVKDVEILARQAGFYLGRSKDKSSL
jgi:predicted amino acid dehydrogenase